ncbi:class I SAM-dependent methyltransferase [Glycomyces xiaoerkulensis]|uniref:class I SAM-dependent methyltransferase n=1 Tax=Glycomyces xiaoerkulensis TaxID=2038139 RepID=UPI001E42829E|nr:class I SAM-dependent methyltransferase [Glycomyces xiaoerkulensis]
MVNDEMRRNWSDGAGGWVANEAIFDSVFAPVTAAVIEAAALRPGHRMLDVGCGSGTLLAAGVEADARPVGIDISPGMAEAARRRVPEATVAVADAQVADLLAEAPGAPFDRVVSRFGVMFFDDPAAAFANVRRACDPEARMAFACWRDLDENPIFTLGSTVLTERLDPPPEVPEPGAPGPTAFADADRLYPLLQEAGWGPVSVDPLDFQCDYGAAGGDGIEERLATILGSGTGRLARERLLPRLGPDGWEALLDDVRAELRRHLVEGTVRFPGAAWLVTASNAAR